MKILKTANCPSLSGRSTLTYEIGCMDGKDIHLRLTGNSGSGIFNKEWISVDSVLSKAKNPITSGSLQAVFEGKSSNSAGFVLAIFLNEKLVQRSKDNLRHYEKVDEAEFEKCIQVLIDSGMKKKTNKKQRRVSS